VRPAVEERTPPAAAPGRAALAAVYATVFLDLLGFGIILPSLPYYAQVLGASGLGLGALFASYSLAQLLGASFLGRLSDRLGRRPVLLLALGGSAAAMVASGLARALPALCLARALAGLFGGSISTAQAYIADSTGPHERARSMGFLGASIGAGFVLGPALGAGLVALGLGFPGAAFTAAGLAVLNLAFAAWKLPESRRPEGAGERSPQAWSAALARPALWPLFAASFLTMAAFVAMETTFAYFAKARFDLDERGFGLALAFAGVVFVAIQAGAVGSLTRRFGVARVAVGGALALGVALALLPFCPGLPSTFAALGLLAAGHGLVSPSLPTLLSRASGAGEQGSVLGVGQSSAALARATAPILAGLLYDVARPLPFLAGALLALAAGALLAGGREIPGA
jgi:DHA1 family tetracycline resistance protein-like MFS transporter